MEIIRVSLISGTTSARYLPITEEQIAKWKAGALVQDAFPELSPADREFFLTGITEQEWDELMQKQEPDVLNA
jgi:hypothetical protein